MQGFSVKILPAGLEIFTENRRLDLAFPSNPGITFAPRTEMTAWCGSLKGAKMEVNENRGRLGRKNFRRKFVKGGNRLKEKDFTGSVKRANNDKGSMLVSDPTELVQPGGNKHSSRFVRLCAAACFIHGAGWHTLHSLSASGKRNNEKKKNHLKPRKSTSWHRRKKKEAQHHQSKHRLGVRLCLFLRLCSSRHTFVQTRFGQWCSDGQNRFYGKILWMGG